MAVIKPGDVVESTLDGRHGRVVTTQDQYVNVEPEGYTSQEQWAVAQVALVGEGDVDSDALDKRVDQEMLDRGLAPTAAGFERPDGLHGREPLTSVNTVELAHPQADLVGSGVHEGLAQRADELLGEGRGDVFRNPRLEYERALEDARDAGVDVEDTHRQRAAKERLEKAEAKLGESESARQARESESTPQPDASEADAGRRPRKPKGDTQSG